MSHNLRFFHSAPVKDAWKPLLFRRSVDYKPLQDIAEDCRSRGASFSEFQESLKTIIKREYNSECGRVIVITGNVPVYVHRLPDETEYRDFCHASPSFKHATNLRDYRARLLTALDDFWKLPGLSPDDVFDHEKDLVARFIELNPELHHIGFHQTDEHSDAWATFLYENLAKQEACDGERYGHACECHGYGCQ
mgnify:CR=1 FL=1